MRLIALATLLTIASTSGLAQRRPQLTPEQTKAMIEKREAIEKELESVAIIDRKVMVPMRDGVRMAADIYRPKDTSKKYPIIFSRTPYNFNFWDVRTGTYRDMSFELDAVRRVEDRGIPDRVEPQVVSPHPGYYRDHHDQGDHPGDDRDEELRPAGKDDRTADWRPWLARRSEGHAFPL